MKFNFLVFFSIILLQGAAQNKLSITGATDIFEDGSTISLSVIYPFIKVLSYPEIQRSAIIKQGKFRLDVKSKTAEFYMVTIKKKDKQEISSRRIFLLPGNVHIVINDSTLKNIKIVNNKGASEYKLFNEQISQIKPPPIYRELKKQYDSARHTDKDLSRKLLVKMDSIEKIFNKFKAKSSLEWIKVNLKSFLNTNVIYDYIKSKENDDTVKNIFYSLPKKVRENSWGKELNYYFTNLIAGVKSPDFTQSDTNGNDVTLSNFKGKYVLLNFWAGWCVPCRAEHPELKSIYEQFKDKNLVVIGVSFDNDKKTWLDAIKKDNLPWLHVSDLNYWQNKIAKSYDVRAVPSNMLLNPDGIIIAKNLNMDMLRKELNRIFK